eukprot:TRINITY_DN51568_c0_g1_i1.p1 TRINITY_DN51568_c0_g1~~TRINITY_DN51568_c0_g1_i1.p1  ORF type:complete len:476 (+),score=152.35 TRINITY_DN51568_c0_g1_i1:96-1430(+)
MRPARPAGGAHGPLRSLALLGASVPAALLLLWLAGAFEPPPEAAARLQQEAREAASEAEEQARALRRAAAALRQHRLPEQRQQRLAEQRERAPAPEERAGQLAGAQGQPPGDQTQRPASANASDGEAAKDPPSGRRWAPTCAPPRRCSAAGMSGGAPHAAAALQAVTDGCAFESFVKQIPKWHPSTAYVVIGANVGPTPSDPVWKVVPRGGAHRKLMVEPIPPIFRALQRNVKRDKMENVTLVNTAISSVEGNISLYCWRLDEGGGVMRRDLSVDKLGRPVRRRGFPIAMADWWAQLCSVSMDRLFSAFDTAKTCQKIGKVCYDHNNSAYFEARVRPNWQRWIAKYTVRSVPVPLLLQEHGVAPESVQYMQIDTEGHDAVVVSTLPFSDPLFRPSALTFEDVLLSDADLEATLARLHAAGYLTCRPNCAGGCRTDNTAAFYYGN